jgi:hypothetical protein
MGKKPVPLLDTEAGARRSVRRNRRPGDQAFAERETRIDDVDPRLQGLDWLRPAEMSKGFLSPPLARLTLRTLYIATDRVALPGWLQNEWETSELSISAGGHPCRIFNKSFPAGVVDLGTYEFLDRSMHIVVVKWRTSADDRRGPAPVLVLSRHFCLARTLTGRLLVTGPRLTPAGHLGRR